MSSWAKFLTSGLGVLVLVTGCQQTEEQSAATTTTPPIETATAAKQHTYGYGHPVSEQQLASWDIDVGPDGIGLPPGHGNAEEGEPIYLQQCAACHGEFGEGLGRYPALIGTQASLTGDRTSKTVGGYWPYSTTLWDYINRAMPFGNAQSLSADQLYAITAYVLALNDIIDTDTEMNAQTLPAVRMPNRDGFITATATDIHAEACMKGCVDKVEIVSRASDSTFFQQPE